MSTDITALMALKGQAVKAPYYLAECTYCGEMYPSKLLNGGEPLFAGDYNDCLCPHCNADDSLIADLGAGEETAVSAWNFQQKRIDALVEALEKAQQHEQEWKSLCEAAAVDLDDWREIDDKSRGLICKMADSIIALNERIAGLESYSKTAIEFREAARGENRHLKLDLEIAEKRIAELESRTVTVKLPKLPVLGSDAEWYQGYAAGTSSMRKDCATALRAAGIQVIEGEG